jgi:hypothetical protein
MAKYPCVQTMEQIMPATVRINYDRYVSSELTGPATDFENLMMEDILDWAEETLDPRSKISLVDLVDLYWAVQFGDYELVLIEDNEDVDDQDDDV